ncbi:hypothetical protein IC582_001095 [Cucumis melo]
MANCLTLQNCLGALNGTYMKVNVSQIDRPRYRTHKGNIATNVLGMCDTKGDFIFVLAGWKGSTANLCISGMRLHDQMDSMFPRVFTISTPPMTFKNFYITVYNPLCYITRFYYLYNVGYPNIEGFLAPYRGQRYHLQEWCGTRNAPTTTWNVIECAFGLLKGRWTILRGKSYYLVQVQCRTILACFLLHNLINREMMNVDNLKDINKGDSAYATTTACDDIHYIETSNE